MNSKDLTVTDARFKQALTNSVNSIIQETVPQMISKSVDGTKIRTGVVTKFYPYLDKAEVNLDNVNKKVLCKLPHRLVGSLIDFYIPSGDNSYCEKLHEPCIIPREELHCLVLNIHNDDSDDYLLLSYYLPNEIVGFAPPNQGNMKITTFLPSAENYIEFGGGGLKVVSKTPIDANYGEYEDDITKLEYMTSEDVYDKTEIDALIEGSGGSDVDLRGYIKKSDVEGLIKNDGTIDTNTYLTNQDITGKVDKIAGKGLSSNDFTDALKSKLENDVITSHQSLESKTISIEKQQNAGTGFAATYILKQGGNSLSPKINIPKDYLVKSASLETVGNVPSQIELDNHLSSGDKYLKFIVNTQEDDDITNLIIPVSDLVDTYTGDNSTIVLSNGVFSVKSNVFAAKNHSHTGYASTNHGHEITDINFQSAQGYQILQDDGYYLYALNDFLIYDPDTDAIYYKDFSDSSSEIAIKQDIPNFSWEIISSNSSFPEKYTLYVNHALHLAELVVQYKPSTAISGTTQTGINVGNYAPLGISIRRSNKTGIDIGVATTGDVYVYGAVSANTNVQCSIMWHY
ncbi:hypothetical protein [Methanobrevibacter sp.]